MNVLTRRIVVIGKTGTGKSSLANTLFGETVFTISHSPNSETSECQEKTKPVNGKTIMWIDTPGFFDTGRSDEDIKREVVRCITLCAPGPHVFVIVLKVEKYTEQEQAVIQKLHQYFSEEALKYTVVVFTHGDQLPEQQRIEEFANESKDLCDLLKRCGNRCHVIDNKYWKNNQQDEYRTNKFQVAKLLNTIDKITVANREGCYTNAMLQAVDREIKQEEVDIKQSSANLSPEEVTQNAKTKVFGKHLIEAAGVTSGVLLAALLGGAMTLMALTRHQH